MPRPTRPHLIKEWTRHGKLIWYFRDYPGPRVRLTAPYGTPEFWAEYDAAMRGERAEKRPTAQSGSLQWLYDRYRETEAWARLSSATRRQRENIFVRVMANAGSEPAAWVTEADIEKGKDDRRATPSQARNFLDAMRGLFRWARKAQHVKTDPTAGVENPKRPKTGGFPVWTQDDVASYEARWAAGTRQRVWLHVLLYTGLRRGDAVRLGRQHVRDGIATIKTEKTGTVVSIPVLAPLAATLAQGPCGDLAFICGVRGAPMAKEAFGNAFSEACREAGFAKSAHGVRKIGATTAVENGATEAELEAIFGWRGGFMASLYTREANRSRLAKGSMHKMIGTPTEQTCPLPDKKVRVAMRKVKAK